MQPIYNGLATYLNISIEDLNRHINPATSQYRKRELLEKDLFFLYQRLDSQLDNEMWPLSTQNRASVIEDCIKYIKYGSEKFHHMIIGINYYLSRPSNLSQLLHLTLKQISREELNSLDLPLILTNKIKELCKALDYKGLRLATDYYGRFEKADFCRMITKFIPEATPGNILITNNNMHIVDIDWQYVQKMLFHAIQPLYFKVPQDIQPPRSLLEAAHYYSWQKGKITSIALKLRNYFNSYIEGMLNNEDDIINLIREYKKLAKCHHHYRGILRHLNKDIATTLRKRIFATNPSGENIAMMIINQKSNFIIDYLLFLDDNAKVLGRYNIASMLIKENLLKQTSLTLAMNTDEIKPTQMGLFFKFHFNYLGAVIVNILKKDDLKKMLTLHNGQHMLSLLTELEYHRGQLNRENSRAFLKPAFISNIARDPHLFDMFIKVFAHLIDPKKDYPLLSLNHDVIPQVMNTHPALVFNYVLHQNNYLKIPPLVLRVLITPLMREYEKKLKQKALHASSNFTYFSTKHKFVLQLDALDTVLYRYIREKEDVDIHALEKTDSIFKTGKLSKFLKMIKYLHKTEENTLQQPALTP